MREQHLKQLSSDFNGSHFNSQYLQVNCFFLPLYRYNEINDPAIKILNQQLFDYHLIVNIPRTQVDIL